MSLLPGGPYDAMGGLFGGMGGALGGLFGRGGGGPVIPQMQGRNPFGGFGGGQQGGIRGLLGDPNFALALLANSSGKSFGEAVGGAGLQAQQMGQQREDDAFKRKYMEAQMQAMGRGPQRKPVIVAGPDGKPMFVDESDAIGKSPFVGAQDGVGDYQPGDYTPASWAKFVKDRDPSVLERHVTPRQEFSPSFQNVTRTNPDGSTQQGTFNTRTGSYDFSMPVVPAGTKPRTDAQGTAEGRIEGERTAKSPRAYDAFKTGIAGLETSMANTVTGPVAGRIPALTASQQIAEGSESMMAPILKNLFREAGEGTFTDADQTLLMKMVPTRKDHAEARKAKIAMIDNIVKAKLGIPDGQTAPAKTPQNPYQNMTIFPRGSPEANQEEVGRFNSLLDKYAPK